MAGNASITIPDLHVIVHLDTWVIFVRQKITVFTIRVMDMGIVL
jgi:arginine deiminase